MGSCDYNLAITDRCHIITPISCRRELKLGEVQLFAHSWDLHIGLAPVSKQEGRPRDVEVQT